MEKVHSAHERRKRLGLIVDQQAQFKMAVTCLSLLLLPSLVLTVAFITDLALEVGHLLSAQTNPADIEAAISQRALSYAVISIAVYFVLAALSVFFSLKVSNKIVGPVHKIESALREIAAGNTSVRLTLRKGDYLKPASELINQIAERMSSSR